MKNKILILLVALCFGCDKQPASEQEKTAAEFGNGITAAANFGGGSGTEISPYLIKDAQQLKKLVDDVNDGNTYSDVYFKLSTNINVTADEWIPIGEQMDYTTLSYFGGVFDGSGHTISGTMKSGRYGSFGFFGAIQDGTVSNLTVTANVNNEYNLPNKNTYTGGIVGYLISNYKSEFTISNCHVKGNVNGGNVNGHGVNCWSNTGGIAGVSSGGVIVKGCSVSGNVTGGNCTSWGYGYIGGIVGRNSSTITDCTVSGTVSEGLFCDEYYYIGGIVGDNTGGNSLIINCKVTASGKIIGVKYGEVTGGIAGSNSIQIESTGSGEYLYHFGKIANCTNEGRVSGGNSVGGLVGDNRGEVYSCQNIGSISGQYFVGGLSGMNGGFVGDTVVTGILHSSLNTGSILGYQTVGGLVGENMGEIHTSLNTGSVSGQEIVGGLAGGNSRGHVYSCCTNKGEVSGDQRSTGNQIGIGLPVEECPEGHTKR